MSGEVPERILVHEATPEDRIAVARILDGALLDVEDLDARLAHGQVLFAADGEEATAVGAIVLAPEGPSADVSQHSPPTEWPKATHIRGIAVRRKHRRNGIGAALVRAALERWSPIVADFEPDVLPFYESLGADCKAGADDRQWALLRASNLGNE
jgi:GNAT superfamily N-acetyltransferase